jgi:hypothetical protein
VSQGQYYLVLVAHFSSALPSQGLRTTKHAIIAVRPYLEDFDVKLAWVESFEFRDRTEQWNVAEPSSWAVLCSLHCHPCNFEMAYLKGQSQSIISLGSWPTMQGAS